MREFSNKNLNKKLKNLGSGLLMASLTLGSVSAFAADNINVTYAGSMGVVMDKYLGPTFAQQHKLNYQGQGQGAYGMANLLASKKSGGGCLRFHYPRSD